ncbi:MAG TPA: NTP transferase domain-containing protein, partial [Myxococcota bacterium]|nr:NTP transferase domain-containing protein [Myxococcota bacterium]
VVAIIQARMGSVRFPGKMLANLHGYPVLEWVLHRVAQATEVDEVVLATTDMARDNPLVELAGRLAVPVHRGSESDVLGRFADAAAAFDAEGVVRICADNPFIDPAEIDWNQSGEGTAPEDWSEGLELAATLDPPSLYEDQLARRLGR